MQTPNVTMSRMKRRLLGRCMKSHRMYANDFSILNPTIWANEALVQLLPNMVLANLIARDFDNKVAKFGDVVNALVPSNFIMTKKGALCDPVVVQDASASSIQVALNQWPQVSFMICDGEEDRNALDLVDTLLTPAVVALAQGVDRILGSSVYQFSDTIGGHLGDLTPDNAIQFLLETREAMNRKNVPLPGRTLILTPGAETTALQVHPFTYANESGETTALREATLGRKFGFDIFMTQTQPEISFGQQATTGTVTAPAGKGATTVTLSSAAGVSVGQWIVIDGDDAPQQIVGLAAAVATIAPGLHRDVAGGAAFRIVRGGTVNNGAGYIGTSMNPRVIGWAKEILVTGFPANSMPELGQLVTFGADTERYAINGLRIISAATGDYGITLDRPLENAIADGDTVNLGPAGKYNFAFLRQAFTLVTRPLPQPRPGTGALSRVVSDPVNKISIRVTITYDGERQGHLVTLDFLMGVGVLDDRTGAVMLG